MKKIKESKEQFVHCPEYRVIRFEREASQDDGLYADGFSICGVFCFYQRCPTNLKIVSAPHAI